MVFHLIVHHPVDLLVEVHKVEALVVAEEVLGNHSKLSDFSFLMFIYLV